MAALPTTTTCTIVPRLGNVSEVGLAQIVSKGLPAVVLFPHPPQMGCVLGERRKEDGCR